MTILLSGAIAVVLVVVAMSFYFQRPPVVKQRVIVNLKHDPNVGFSGILWKSHGAWIVLRDVQAMQRGGPVTAMDGEAVFHRDSVLFMQVPPGSVQ